MATKHEVKVRRVYEEPARQDGTRVLVDRIWPRGLTKERAALDEWCKGVAPSTALRKWYGHDPSRFEEFARRYRSELEDADHVDAFGRLRDLVQSGPVTLLTVTKDPEISEVKVLADLLRA